jgi:hypothetical protein
MEEIKEYIEEVLGNAIIFRKVKPNELGALLPYYMTEMYSFFRVDLMNQQLFLFQPNNQEELSILQLVKHQELIEEKLNAKSAVILSHVESFQRKRLIEKRVQFIIPGKQLFLPFLLIDLKEGFAPKRQKRESLSPSAQMMLIWYLLDKNRKIDFDSTSLKELANFFGYSAMTLSNAANELLVYGLSALVEQGKEKFIQFQHDKQDLWHRAESHLLSPVLKTIYVDHFPNEIGRIKSNFSALSEYTEMNPSTQMYYAIDKTVFYGLEKNGKFKNANPYEGKYCIEVWKYDPNKLTEIVDNDEFSVDPLSLYLSLKESPDERTEYALEHLLNYIW